MENLYNEINNINQKLNEIAKLLKNEVNKDVYKEIKSRRTKISSKDIKLFDKITEDFKNDWEKPILPILVLSMGKGLGNWFGKYIEYIAAGVIVTGIIPSILQFG